MKMLIRIAISLMWSTPFVAMAQTSHSAAPSGKLANDFSAWAGSPGNAAALVSGLRNGTPITLTSPAGPGGTMEASTFSPATKPMGYGNVRIALSLAKAQLASQGVENPTPAQLQATLAGSPAGPMQPAQEGVLQMRASGMGWGRIAGSMGFRLGEVMGQKQASTSYSSAYSGSGVTTAAGRTAGSGQFGKTTARTGEAGKAQGIVQGGGLASHGAGNAGSRNAAGFAEHRAGHGKP